MEARGLYTWSHTATDGMLTSEMSGSLQPAGARSASGELWFPSLKGVVRIDPSGIPASESMPVLIEQVIAGDLLCHFRGNIVYLQALENWKSTTRRVIWPHRGV